MRWVTATTPLSQWPLAKLFDKECSGFDQTQVPDLTLLVAQMPAVYHHRRGDIVAV